MSFFVTSLPWMHGLRTDLMIWFFFGTSNRMPICLANLVDLYFTVLLGTQDASIGKLHFIYRFFSSGMISNFLKVLSTALQYLESSPREQLRLERSHLFEDHQLQTERVKKPHSDFWLRWNSENDFKEKLQSSRSKILNKDLTLEELRILHEKQHCEELLATSESIGDLVEKTNRRLNFRMNHPMFSTSCVDNSLLLSDVKKADGNLLENFAQQKYFGTSVT